MSVGLSYAVPNSSSVHQTVNDGPCLSLYVFVTEL